MSEMRFVFRVALLVLVLGFVPARPEPRAQELDGEHARFVDARLDALVGRWVVERQMGSRVVRNRLDADWVLNHQFLRLHYRDVVSPPEYEAMVFVGWNHSEKRYVAHWIDVFGGRSSETLGFGRAEGDSIVFDFAYPDGAFRTTYRWHPTAREWTSRGESRDSTGAWRPFMTDRFRRVRPGR